MKVQKRAQRSAALFSEELVGSRELVGVEKLSSPYTALCNWEQAEFEYMAHQEEGALINTLDSQESLMGDCILTGSAHSVVSASLQTHGL